jgi:hypothetical protein
MTAHPNRPDVLGQILRPLALAGLASLALLSLLAAPAAASSAALKTHHYPITQPPLREPAGEVCPFALQATFPVQKLYETDYYDSSGTLVRSSFTGPLIAKFTNLATGAAAVRNLSGFAVFTYNPDGSLTIVSDGHLGLGLHQGDSPSGQYLVTSGHARITISASGVKTLTELDGTSENICQTLAA